GLRIGNAQRVERCPASQVAVVPVDAAGRRVTRLPEANDDVRLLQGVLLLDGLIEQRAVVEDPEATEHRCLARLVQGVREAQAWLEGALETRPLRAVGEVAFRID